MPVNEVPMQKLSERHYSFIVSKPLYLIQSTKDANKQGIENKESRSNEQKQKQQQIVVVVVSVVVVVVTSLCFTILVPFRVCLFVGFVVFQNASVFVVAQVAICT